MEEKEKPPRTINAHHIEILQDYIKNSEAKWSIADSPSAFAEECNGFYRTAFDMLLSRLGTYTHELSERDLQELCYETIDDLGITILRDIPFAEDREKRIMSALERMVFWDNKPTDFETFLTQQKLFDHGQTNFEPYKAQHHILQNTFRGLFSESKAEMIEQQLREFDENVQIQTLDTLFTEKVMHKFEKLYTAQRKHARSHPEKETPSETKAEQLTPTPAQSENKEFSDLSILIDNLKKEKLPEREEGQAPAPLTDRLVNQYLDAMIQTLNQCRSINKQDYLHLIGKVAHKAKETLQEHEFNHTPEEITESSERIATLTRKAGALGNSYFESQHIATWVHRTDASYAPRSNQETILFPQDILSLTNKIKKLIVIPTSEQPLSLAQKRCNGLLQQLSAMLENKQVLPLQTFKTLRSVAYTNAEKGVERDTRLNDNQRKSIRLAIYNIMSKIEKHSSAHFNAIDEAAKEARHTGRN